MRKISCFVLAVVAIGCGRRDDGTIRAEPEQKVQTGIPTIFMAPKPDEPGAPAPNPLAMPLKHDGPAQAAAVSAPLDPCAPRNPGTGPLAMRLRHDGKSDDPQRNPLCMRLK